MFIFEGDIKSALDYMSHETVIEAAKAYEWTPDFMAALISANMDIEGGCILFDYDVRNFPINR